MIKHLVVVAAAAVVSCVAFEQWSLDGFQGVLAGATLHEDTVYTTGYSDAGFRSVQIGMSLGEVEKLIGPPESTWSLEDRGGKAGETGARWSYSPHDTNYRCRVLLFRNGHVYDKHSEFYVD